MSTEIVQVLLIDDDAEDCQLVQAWFLKIKRKKHVLEWAPTFEEGLQISLQNRHDVVLVDYRLGARDGLELIKEATTRGCVAPLILLTCQGDYDTDVDAMKAGAADYLDKGKISPATLERAIRYSMENKKIIQALAQSEERMRTVIESALDAVVIMDKNGSVMHWNPQAESMFGWKTDEIMGKAISGSIIPERYREEHRKGLKAFQETKNGPILNRRIETFGLRRDGTEFPVELTVTPLRMGEEYIFSSFISDISERWKRQEALLLSAKIMENAMDGIMVTDIHGTIESVNPAFTYITGYRPEEAIGRNPRILKSDRHDGEFYREMWSSLTGKGQWEGEIWNRRKDGDAYSAWLRINAIKDDQGAVSHYVGIFSDVTLRKLQEQRLKHMANHDALTGLPNRLAFSDRLEHALDRASRYGNLVAVLFIDLDNFKPINDTLGHFVGDSVLREVARRLKGCTRKMDTVARLGGDEFVIILQDFERAETAGDIAGKIIRELSETITVDEHSCRVGASIGIGFYPSDAEDAEALINAADSAMYQAKKEGKNRHRYFSSAGALQERISDLRSQI